MAVLVKPDIEQAIQNRDLSITIDGEPAKNLHIGPNSIDLHLHKTLKIYAQQYAEVCNGGYHPPLRKVRCPDTTPILESQQENSTAEFDIPDTGIVLQPGVLYLARTQERTYTPKHVPLVGGRSSTARLGISIHQTAGFGDVGFDGTWTLEISVMTHVRMHAGMRIAQLWLFETSSSLRAEEQYKGRYQGQVDPTAYRGHLP